ncbi:MAG TPA: type II toxin-antitoxin system prevent-host-death family antitoxin [Lentisphaeria bacterium]|nr:MAG: hypothetical protein A2X45_22715 [Lentisphaerae bacterium GWF2_50_93]HCE44531.1 type II toxin-antitoxin system prevent-host-death family antitoxin [Lentisphaeria bacterium]
METMVISEFKAKCIRVMKDINRTKHPLIITIRGVPVARIEPVRSKGARRTLGSMKGSIKIKGDIVSSDFSSDWELNR